MKSAIKPDERKVGVNRVLPQGGGYIQRFPVGGLPSYFHRDSGWLNAVDSNCLKYCYARNVKACAFVAYASSLWPGL